MFDIAGAIKTVAGLVDDLHTSKEEKRAFDLEEKKVDATIATGQMAINRYEAQHKSVFVAGWRPAIGWTGAFALAYKFVFYELILWAWSLAEICCDIPAGVEPPPPLDATQLYPIILGMLGIGGMRSYDKAKNTVTNAIKGVPAIAKKSKGFFGRLFNKG